LLAAASEVNDNDEAGAKMVRTALKKVRCAVESKRKEEKSESLKLGRAIDAVAKVIFDVVEPVENRLEAIEKAEEIAAQKAKLERSNLRREELAAIGGIVPDSLLLMEMNDQAWLAYIAGEKMAKAQREQTARVAAEKEAARNAEEARLRSENEALAKAAREAQEARQAAELAARKEMQAIEAKAAQERAAREKLEAAERERLAEEAKRAKEEANTKAKAARAAELVLRALTNIVSAVAKHDEQSPCSAAVHEALAIADLAEACPHWEPGTARARGIVARARELAELVRGPRDTGQQSEAK
jgi:hypothetical protein